MVQMILLSLPPSGALHRPPPSSEGGKVAERTSSSRPLLLRGLSAKLTGGEGCFPLPSPENGKAPSTVTFSPVSGLPCPRLFAIGQADSEREFHYRPSNIRWVQKVREKETQCGGVAPCAPTSFLKKTGLKTLLPLTSPHPVSDGSCRSRADTGRPR